MLTPMLAQSVTGRDKSLGINGILLIPGEFYDRGENARGIDAIKTYSFQNVRASVG
jgi:hypothetical protein